MRKRNQKLLERIEKYFVKQQIECEVFDYETLRVCFHLININCTGLIRVSTIQKIVELQFWVPNKSKFVQSIEILKFISKFNMQDKYGAYYLPEKCNVLIYTISSLLEAKTSEKTIDTLFKYALQSIENDYEEMQDFFIISAQKPSFPNLCLN